MIPKANVDEFVENIVWPFTSTKTLQHTIVDFNQPPRFDERIFGDNCSNKKKKKIWQSRIKRNISLHHEIEIF